MQAAAAGGGGNIGNGSNDSGISDVGRCDTGRVDVALDGLDDEISNIRHDDERRQATQVIASAGTDT